MTHENCPNCVAVGLRVARLEEALDKVGLIVRLTRKAMQATDRDELHLLVREIELVAEEL